MYTNPEKTDTPNSQTGSQHPYHSPVRRGLYAMTLIAGLVVVGTLGMHFIEGMSYVDAFYFISMIVTAEGPSYSPSTHMGKIFAAMMAFVSVGTVVVSLGFLFGPFLGGLWRIGYMKLEHELEHLRHNNPDQEKPKE